MIWRFLRSVPKWLIALTLFALITGVLVFKYFQWAARDAFAKARPAQIADTRAAEALVESKQGRLLLVDNDLCDLNTGAVIFRAWLKDGMPAKLYYEAAARKFIAQYEQGFMRVGLNGATEATLLPKFKVAYSDDLKWALFARDKDIWRADIDWQAFQFANEKRITSVQQFNDLYFADSIVTGTEKMLLVKLMNKVVHVNLATGDVKPFNISLTGIAKRLSPDRQWITGLDNGRFYCYGADANEAEYIQIGRGAINDYQWLGNDKCAAIAAQKTVILYDRLKKSLTTVAALPAPCVRIGEPSPDGRFVFCMGRNNGALVDVENRTAVAVTGGAGVSWVNDDTFAFSREVTDSDLRGTWLQTVGQGERRISPEPYRANDKGASLLILKPFGLVILATMHGVAKMKTDGKEYEAFIERRSPPQRILDITSWPD